jgi:hypothetical protein
MAIFRGASNQAAQQGPAMVPLSGGVGGGKVAGFYDTFVVPAAGMAANDQIEMGPPTGLKKGDVVVNVTIWHDALGAAALLAAGDDGAPARYVTAAAAAAAGLKQMSQSGFGYQLTQDRPFLIQITGGAPTPAATIKCHWAVLRA